MKRVVLVLVGLLLIYSEAEGQLNRRRIINFYSTTFSGADENPISERGAWVNGKLSGVDWSNVRNSGHKALGTQSTNPNGPPYDDSVAILAGTWGATQTLTSTVFTQNQTAATFEEVEHWSRATVGPNSIKGYETAYRVINDGSQYIGIVKWLGALNSFSQLGSNCTLGTDGVPGLVDGDTIQTLTSGTSTTTIVAKVNGVTRCTQTDSSSPYTTGNPGMGIWLRVNGSGSINDYGLRSLTVTGS